MNSMVEQPPPIRGRRETFGNHGFRVLIFPWIVTGLFGAWLYRFLFFVPRHGMSQFRRWHMGSSPPPTPLLGSSRVSPLASLGSHWDEQGRLLSLTGYQGSTPSSETGIFGGFARVVDRAMQFGPRRWGEVRERWRYTNHLYERYLVHAPCCVIRRLNPLGPKPEPFKPTAIVSSPFDTQKRQVHLPRVKTTPTTSERSRGRPPPTIGSRNNPPRVSSPSPTSSCPFLPVSPSGLTRPPVREWTAFEPAIVSDAGTAQGASTPDVVSLAPHSPKRLKVAIRGLPSSPKIRDPGVAVPLEGINGFRLTIKRKPSSMFKPVALTDPSSSLSKPDYETARLEIKAIMRNPGVDDGSLAPVILRLAWHCCGSYDKVSHTGGSNGSTMRYPTELTDVGNIGLEVARLALEPVKYKLQWISYSDLWTLAGTVAVEEMGGPRIPWRGGRVDCPDDAKVPPNGRLPEGYKAADHIRTVFCRLKMNDQETVALLGAHAVGRCHKRFSGWEGAWTYEPLVFDNSFFKVLLEEQWTVGVVPETSREQYFNADKSLMMLFTDMELIKDPDFKPWVERYAADQTRFFADFSLAFAKLLELGVDRDANGKVLPKT